MDYWNHDQDKLIRFRWCQACVAATRLGVQRQVCLAYSQKWWWECPGLGLHECCRHWGATVKKLKNINTTSHVCILLYYSVFWSSSSRFSSRCVKYRLNSGSKHPSTAWAYYSQTTALGWIKEPTIAPVKFWWMTIVIKVRTIIDIQQSCISHAFSRYY